MIDNWKNASRKICKSHCFIHYFKIFSLAISSSQAQRIQHIHTHLISVPYVMPSQPLSSPWLGSSTAPVRRSAHCLLCNGLIHFVFTLFPKPSSFNASFQLLPSNYLQLLCNAVFILNLFIKWELNMSL